MNQTDPYNLQRFLDAQAPIYQQVCAQLRAGQKRTHWIWYIFPQIAGLGKSAMSQRYAISGAQEAEAYLRHDILGQRLMECTRLVLAVEGRSILQIFGAIDSQKFQSCMTLFAQVQPEAECFRKALDMHFGGKFDDLTIQYLAR